MIKGSSYLHYCIYIAFLTYLFLIKVILLLVLDHRELTIISVMMQIRRAISSSGLGHLTVTRNSQPHEEHCWCYSNKRNTRLKSTTVSQLEQLEK